MAGIQQFIQLHNMPKPLPGAGYIINSTNKGFSFDILKDNVEDYIAPLKPFDCIVSKVKISDVPLVYEHRLKIVQGRCPAFVIQNVVDESPDSAETLLGNIIQPNIYPSSSRVSGADENSIYMDHGGYLKLTPENDYMLFLFLLQPTYVDAEAEFKAIQLVLSEIGISKPNSIIDTLESKCFFEINFEGSFFGIGYNQSWCIRDNIAQFVWNSDEQRFNVYQYTNNPKLFYPIFNALDQTSQGFTLTDPMIASFSGYVKDLNTSPFFETPKEQDKFPNLFS